MREVDSLTVGWVNSSIHAALTAGLLAEFGSVLISSIDSDTNPSESGIGAHILALEPTCRFLGAGVIVPGHKLVQIAEPLNLFCGFDEMWCFARVPKTPKPADLWLVAPLNIETEQIPPLLASWMAEADCKLALGDGIGLNFATPRQEIALRLEDLVR